MRNIIPDNKTSQTKTVANLDKAYFFLPIKRVIVRITDNTKKDNPVKIEYITLN